MTDWRDWSGTQLHGPQAGQDNPTLGWEAPLEGTAANRPDQQQQQQWPSNAPFNLPGPSAMYRPGMNPTSRPADASSMSNEQLFSAIMNIDVPPTSSNPTPSGMQSRQPPVSLDDAKSAIKTAKASTGSKPSSSKAELAAGESGSEEEDMSPESSAGKNKRVLANRQSAHRSRLRKLQYIQDLENNVNRLQGEIGQIQPQLAFLREKYSGLSSQNHKLRDRVAALLNEAHFKESLNTSLRQEIATMAGTPADGVRT